MESKDCHTLFDQYVMPTYGRFPLTFERGEGHYLWDTQQQRYLDMGGGIAVNILGHAHPALREVLCDQAGKLWHCSNLYHHRRQGQLAEELVSRIGSGKVFFSNSGAEANEGLFKLARRYGHEQGRHEIITFTQSFHGRTLGGIAATGQMKVKEGFGPMTPGFVHAEFNDLNSVKQRISPSTVAIMLEGIQGEGGIRPATEVFLKGLRQLCQEHDLLLLWDGVQCGHYRTGHFQSYQSILEEASSDVNFMPDAIAMAKSLGGGFPIGAFWVRQQHASLLGPGSHGTTYGGNPLACAVALKILHIIEQEGLADQARKMGDALRKGLTELKESYEDYIEDIRGMGLMLGLVLREDSPLAKKSEGPVSLTAVKRLHDHGLLTIPSGTQVIRLLPALNIQEAEVSMTLSIIQKALKNI